MVLEVTSYLTSLTNHLNNVVLFLVNNAQDSMYNKSIGI